jgi:hypothetical protein
MTRCSVLLRALPAVCAIVYAGASLSAQTAGPSPGADGRHIDSVYIISVLDPSFDTARGKIDEFILPDNGWRQTRQKIVQRATEKAPMSQWSGFRAT